MIKYDDIDKIKAIAKLLNENTKSKKLFDNDEKDEGDLNNFLD